MKERINKQYRPAELEAAIYVLNEVIHNTVRDPSSLLIALYNKGWRLVKVDND